MTKQQLHYSFYGATDKGLVRENNEDALLMNETCGLFAVADGLGGLPGGAIASELALNVLEKSVLECKNHKAVNLDSIFNHVLEVVNEFGETINDELGIGTTLTTIKVNASKAKIGHVGDSGVVIFNPKGYKKVTKDHTMANQMRDSLKAGENKKIPEYYDHMLVQCIGLVKNFKAQTEEIPLQKGDRILLYTDGVTKELSFEEIHTIINETSSPKDAVKKVIQTANSREGIDNITLILIYVD